MFPHLLMVDSVLFRLPAGDQRRQPVCDLSLRRRPAGFDPPDGPRPAYLSLSGRGAGARPGPGPRSSRRPVRLRGGADPEAEEPGAAERPAGPGGPGLSQEPGSGPVLSADAAQHAAGDGAGRAGGGPAGGRPPAEERYPDKIHPPTFYHCFSCSLGLGGASTLTCTQFRITETECSISNTEF